MIHEFGLIIKKIVPVSILYKLLNILLKPKINKAKRAFKQALSTPVYLDQNKLKSLQQKYSYTSNYGYEPQTLEKRGKERAGEMLSLIHRRKEEINTFLEIGCFDGMVSCILQRMGKKTTAIDKESRFFDKRALREDVKFLKMDATHLQFEDESFDFVFSYNTFEHFANPDAVLQEAIRVVKTNGYIYLNFGSLYMSPLGLHAYKSITIPYCQFLFSKKLLKDFIKEQKLDPIPFNELNRWSLENYRKLWSQYSDRLKKIKYFEKSNPFNLDLVIKYPSCFKSKTNCFDNLTVSVIEVLFKKIS
jgi:ubiquinone/menaquinone biosynthesis C-methylase UbiE